MKLRNFFANSQRKLLVIFIDICCFAAIDSLYFLLSLLPQFNLVIDPSWFFIASVIFVCLAFVIRMMFGVYHSVWRYTNTSAYTKMVISDALAALAAILVCLGFGQYAELLHIAVVAAFTALATLSSRFVYRLIYKRMNKMNSHSDGHKIPVAIVGAGQIGVLLAQELIYNKNSNYKPIFFIDRDKSKAGGRVAGLKVYFEDNDIIGFIKSQNISEIFVAISELDNETSSKIYDFYKKTSCKIKIYDTAINGYYSGGSSKRRTIREEGVLM